VDGARCELDTTVGLMVCVESLPELCVYHSDCPEPLICDEGQRCVLECANDVDCDPFRPDCIANRCYPLGYTPPDAGI
jgi:hypothetical protein